MGFKLRPATNTAMKPTLSSPLAALSNLQRAAASYFTGPPPSTYEPVNQDDSRTSHDAAPTSADASRTSDASPPPGTVYRDAAAMMLIKLGHDPAQRIRISPETNTRILRRIDIALLPLMLIVYFLHALDKATLSYASIFGLIDDTGLEGDQFSWLGSIVFLAQLVFQLPVALALVKLPIGKFTSVMVLGWGLTLTCMTKAHDFSSLLVARFFLGAFEASIGPSFLAITQMWWRRREQTLRVGSWYCMNGLTWVFGSLITYGLARIDSEMKSYQVIFFFGACGFCKLVLIDSDHISLLRDRHPVLRHRHVPMDARLPDRSQVSLRQRQDPRHRTPPR